jgi:LysR family nitrogen assimilation transcriptional regulator
MSDTLLRLRLFAAVYEERSFTAAGLRENATQSGVTQHVRKLEDQHGVKLFVRGTGSVVPTPAGDAYYRSCVEVLRLHEHSRQAIRAFGSGLNGEVLVGLTPTMTRAALAPALVAFKAAHPNVSVRVIDAYSDIVMAKVRAGELDFGIVPGFSSELGIRSELFARTPEFLVSGPQSRLGLQHCKPVRLAALGPIKLVVPSMLQVRRAYLERYLAATGTVVAERMEIDSSLAAVDFVGQTDWVSVHPAIAMVREIDSRQLVVNPIVGPTLELELFRVERARQPLTSEASAFLKVLSAQTQVLRASVDLLHQDC